MRILKKNSFLDINLLFLFFLLALISNSTQARSVIFDTVGFASGQLSKVSQKNTFGSAFVGEILLGRESTAFISIGHQPANLVTNPWRFCFEDDHYEQLENLIGSYVILEYKTPKKSSLLSCSAANELVGIYPMTDAEYLGQTEHEGDIRTFDNEIAMGVDFGRITNAIRNRNVNRSYFLTVQLGNSGDKFRHFVMDDPELFEFAIESLKISAKVRVHYSDRISSANLHGRNIRSFVWKLEIID